MPPRPYPRTQKTKHPRLRAKIDRFALDVARELEDAYYGTCLTFDDEGQCLTRANDGWRHGASHPVTIDGVTHNPGANAITSPGLRKALFDKLHGTIWKSHRLSLYLQNEADGKPFGDLHIRDKWVPDAADPDNIRRRVTRDLKAELVEDLKRDGVVIAAVPPALRQTLKQLVP